MHVRPRPTRRAGQLLDEPAAATSTSRSTTWSRSTPPTAIDPDRVLRRMVYEHPIYTPDVGAAQRRLPALNTGRTAFAGAYHGWGFHEDGCRVGRRGRGALGAAGDAA